MLWAVSAEMHYAVAHTEQEKGRQWRRESVITCAQDKITASGGSRAAPVQAAFLYHDYINPQREESMPGLGLNNIQDTKGRETMESSG